MYQRASEWPHRRRPGLFDRPLTDPGRTAILNNPSHQSLALRAAEEGVVMLINRPPPPGSAQPAGRPLLPLSKARTKTIAVLGPNGASYRGVSLESLIENLKLIGKRCETSFFNQPF